MKESSRTLSNELRGIELDSTKAVQNLDYENILVQQHNMIMALHRQVKYLRKFLKYAQSASELTYNSQTNKENVQILTEQKGNSKACGFKGLLSQIMKILQVKDPDEIISKIKEIEEKANRKIEPVFVERIKEKEVPVVVEKLIPMEKIVYQERIVQIPVYKEKVGGKFIQKPEYVQPFKQKSKNITFNDHQNSNYGKHGMYKKKRYYQGKDINKTYQQKEKVDDNSHYRSKASGKINQSTKFKEKY